jgi:LmbE family N-acetylglucosaminyl deacetylase
MAKNKKTILIIAPHPDDEIVGCGGVYLQNAHKGNDVHVLYLTKGALSGEERRAKLRRQAVVSIAKELKIPTKNLTFLDNHELGDLLEIKKAKETIRKITETISDTNPHSVYVTAYEGGHIDHDLANLFVAVACRQVKNKKIKYYEYEVYNNNIPVSIFGAKKKIQIIIRESVKIMTKNYFYWDESRFPKRAAEKPFKLNMSPREIGEKLALFERYRTLAEKPLEKKEPRKLLSPYKKEDLLQEMPKHDYSKPPHIRFPLSLGYELAWKIKFDKFRKIAEKLQNNR